MLPREGLPKLLFRFAFSQSFKDGPRASSSADPLQFIQELCEISSRSENVLLA